MAIPSGGSAGAGGAVVRAKEDWARAGGGGVDVRGVVVSGAGIYERVLHAFFVCVQPPRICFKPVPDCAGAWMIARGAQRFHARGALKLFAAVALPALAIISWGERMFKTGGARIGQCWRETRTPRCHASNLARRSAAEVNLMTPSLIFNKRRTWNRMTQSRTTTSAKRTWKRGQIDEDAMGELRKAIANCNRIMRTRISAWATPISGRGTWTRRSRSSRRR